MQEVEAGRAANSPDNSSHAVSLLIIHMYGSTCSEVDHKRENGQRCLPPRVSSVALPWLLNQKKTPRSSDPGAFQSINPSYRGTILSMDDTIYPRGKWVKRATAGAWDNDRGPDGRARTRQKVD